MLWLTGLGRLGADNIGTSSQRCRRMLFQRQTDAQQPTANCLTTTRKTNFKTGKSERHRDSRNDTVSCIFYIFHWWNYFELMRKCIVCVTYPFLNWYIPNTICLIRNHLSLFFYCPYLFFLIFFLGLFCFLFVLFCTDIVRLTTRFAVIIVKLFLLILWFQTHFFGNFFFKHLLTTHRLPHVQMQICSERREEKCVEVLFF